MDREHLRKKYRFFSPKKGYSDLIVKWVITNLYY